jgi:hypothetical protein
VLQVKGSGVQGYLPLECAAVEGHLKLAVIGAILDKQSFTTAASRILLI